MMWPGTTISPPNFLTPSRRPRLSRPLREEPPAFLCAIRHSFLMPRTAGTPDLGNPQHGLLLPMPLLAPIIVPPLLLKDDDFGRPGLLDDRSGDRRSGQNWGSRRDLGPVADHQHLAELDHGAWFAGELLDRNHIVLGDLVLLAAGPDYREHHTADMVSRAPDATAEKAADGVTPSAKPCTNALSRSRNTTKIIVRPLCTAATDDKNRYKSLQCGQISTAQNNGIWLARTTEFAQSSGTEKQRIARLELALACCDQFGVASSPTRRAIGTGRSLLWRSEQVRPLGQIQESEIERSERHSAAS